MKTFSQSEVEQTLIKITQQLLLQSGDQSQREIKIEFSLQQHLGIDSLARAELFRRIEKEFGVTLPDKMFAEVESLKDITNYLCSGLATIKVITTSHFKARDAIVIDTSKAKSLTDILFLYGEQASNKAHIYFQEESGHETVITYGDLLSASLRVAAGLKRNGLIENDTVAIMQPTSPNFFYAFFGTLLAGGIPVPIYPPFRAHMLETYSRTEARILKNAEVRMLLTFDRAESLSYLLKGLVPSLKQVLTVEPLLAEKPIAKPFHADSDNFAFIQYTSGSTSDPKGVLLTHYNLLSNIRAYGNKVEIQPTDIVVSWLPLYHDMGLIGMWLGSLVFGIPLVLMTPFSFLNRPEKWLWTIHRYRGTHSAAPNFAYDLCIRKIEAHMIEGLDLSSWKLAANGAEKIYPSTLKQFIKKFEPYGFKKQILMPVYGLAESTVGLTIPPLGRGYKVDHIDRKEFEENQKAIPTTNPNGLEFVACGYPLEGHDIRIVDEKNNELPERNVGQLQFRGPSSMQGYYHNENATKAVVHDGWIDSGDLGYLVDGELYITGRKKDLIIKAGRNLYPAEIEEIIGNISGVRQGCVAAFGITDKIRGTEQLIVVAETRLKAKEEKNTLRNQIQEEVASILDIVPDQIVLVKPRLVPKTSSGKLQRAACKKMFIENRFGQWQIPPWLQIFRLGTVSFANQIKKIANCTSLALYTAYIGSLGLLTIFPLWAIVKFAKPTTAANACKRWAKFLIYFSFCKLEYHALEKLFASSPVIYAANHASYVDAILLLALLPPETKFVGKKELQNVPILRTFITKLNHIVVDRMDLPKGIQDTKQIENKLEKKFSVLIFPEGTFSYGSGLRPFRLGAFKIATETNIPICPIAIKGTRHILRGNEKLLRPAKISITVGDLIFPKGFEWQNVIELRDATRQFIAAHCGESSLDYIAAQVVAVKPDRKN